jgi:Protein of unknown function (DUF3551)
MFKMVIGLTVVAFVMLLSSVSSPATADPYPWCANYGTPGGTNCGFVTIEQCRATISGMGGWCEPNQFYTGPDNLATARKRKYKPA